MTAAIWLVLLLCAGVAHAAPATTAPVVQRDGRPFASASALSGLGLAVKELPGRDAIVACHEDRCAPLKEFRREGADILVSLDALCEALNLSAAYDQARATVRLTTVAAPAATSAPDVGRLAPDFKLTRLDGTPVALSDFRGKRVLINSWASW
ncbi:MAG: redoxin family protein [Verrucomicrobiota bacterium]